jgi:hypothetical protein
MNIENKTVLITGANRGFLPESVSTSHLTSYMGRYKSNMGRYKMSDHAAMRSREVTLGVQN